MEGGSVTESHIVGAGDGVNDSTSSLNTTGLEGRVETCSHPVPTSQFTGDHVQNWIGV